MKWIVEKYYIKSMDRLAIGQEKLGSYWVITPAGEIAIGFSEYVIQAVGEALNAGETKIALDLSKVTLLSSVGLTAIIKIQKLVGDKRADLRLVCPDGHIREIFMTTGLDRKANFVFSLNDLPK